MPNYGWDERPPAPWEQQESAQEHWGRKQRESRGEPAPTGGIRVGTTIGTQRPVYILPDQLSTHMHVVGGTGVGKSYFLEGLIKQLIMAGRGVCVIDPHGVLYENLIDFCASVHRDRPDLQLASRLIPFNVAETRASLAFNPMARNARVLTYQVTAFMEAVRKCWGQDSFQATPRLARWLFNTGYAVIDSELTMAQIYHMVDPKPNTFRTAITARVTNPRIRAEWEWLGKMQPDKREERLESTFNRMKLFVEHEVIRNIIGQYTNTLDFSTMLAGQKILLVNLAGQNTISQDDQHMLGTLLINELVTAAFSRPRNERPPFYVFIDEFQNFVTKDMCEILDGGRKFGLHLILAHQHLHQLREKDPEVYYSVLTNARLKVVFGGLIDEDLDILARELYTGEFNPNEVKDEIWQTKFRPVESSRVIEAVGWTSGSGKVTHQSLSSGTSYISGSESWDPGTYTYTDGSAFGSARSESSTDSANQTCVPFYEFHEFRELSSRTFRSLEEQLYIKKAQMKREPRQHAAILVPDKQVQIVKTPTLRTFTPADSEREAFLLEAIQVAGCFKSPDQAAAERAALEHRLLVETRSAEASAPQKKKGRGKSGEANPFEEIVHDRRP